MTLPVPPRILLVDDEPNVLDGLRRQLRREFAVDVAGGGADGLRALSTGPYAVVVSDFRMPLMDGAQFLAAARTAAPDTTRMLLTGQADLTGAAAVVNDGQIFRMLLKPVPDEELRTALRDAVAQHRLRLAERELLEQTLRGCVRALVEVLALTSPAMFARATRVRRLVSALLDTLVVPERWVVDLAAELSLVGAVSLPPAVARRLDSGLELTATERAMIDGLPEVAVTLLAGIPRLEPVRAAIRYSRRNFDGTGQDEGEPSGAELPTGARVLRLATDFDELTARGVSDPYALNMLRKRVGFYDPVLLDALAALVLSRGAHLVQEMTLAELYPSLVLDESIRTRTGTLLVPKGHEITASLLMRLRNFAAMPDGVAEPILVLATVPPVIG